jgi:hypothetical protein
VFAELLVCFSRVFGRKALKIKRVWNFTKVYRHKYRRQCTDFCLKKCAKTHLRASLSVPSPLTPHFETPGSGFELSKNKWEVDICLFIVIVITHRRFSIINNGGGEGLKLTPRVSQAILFGGLSKQLGGSTFPTPPAIQTLPWLRH